MTWADAATGLGAALLASLWITGLIGVWTAAALRLLDTGAARLRYGLALSALVTMASAPPLWYLALEHREASWLGWCAAAWALGVVAALLRIVNSGRSVRRLLHGASLAPFAAQQRLQRNAAAFGIARTVTLAESAEVELPCAIGSAAPVVVVPVGLASRLTASQFDAITAHELAHIARHDYNWHLLQLAAAALLFHHPAAWWLSNVIDREREACCDALAGRVVDPLELADALAAIERTRDGDANESPGNAPLLDRVRRLIRVASPAGPTAAPTAMHTAFTLTAAAAVCAALALLGAPLVVPTVDAVSAAGSLAVGLGLLVGVRHAFEPDHLLAVATLVTRERRTGEAMRLGASWGLGHALALLALGSILSAAHGSLPDSVGQALEFGVGVMLVAMGARALRDARRIGASGPARRHRHGRRSHTHATGGEHLHVGGLALAKRPLAVGMAHGFAGSGALIALATATLPTLPEQLAFMLLFGIGAAIGMAAVAALAGWQLARMVRTGAGAATLSATTGAAAVVLGLFWIAPLLQSVLRG